MRNMPLIPSKAHFKMSRKPSFSFVFFLVLVSRINSAHERESHPKHKLITNKHFHNHRHLSPHHRHGVNTKYNFQPEQKQGDDNGTLVSGSNLLAFENSSTQAAVIVDLTQNLIYLLNGETGGEITINPQTGQLSQNQNIWHSQENFTKFVQSISSLQLNGGDDQIDPSQGNEILKKLGVTGDDLRSLIKIIFQLKHEGLKLRDTIQAETTKLTFFEVIHRLEGLQQLGVVRCIKQLDLKAITAPNSLESLLVVLQSLNVNVDLKNLGDVLNDAEKLFEALNKLSDSNNSIDNWVRVLHKLTGVIRGKIQLDLFIKYLINEGASGGLIVNSLELKSVILSIIKTVQGLNPTTPLSGFLQTLQNLVQSSFILDGVNFSEVLKAIKERDLRGVIFNIVHILIQIGSNINPIHTIPILVENIINIVNTNDGVNVVNKIIPNLDTSALGKGSNPLQEILQNIPKIIEHSPLTKIPVIGQIIFAISKAVEAFGGPEGVIKDLQSGTLIRHIPIIGQILGMVANIPGPPQIIQGVFSNVEKGVGSILGGVLGINGDGFSTTENPSIQNEDDRHWHKGKP